MKIHPIGTLCLTTLALLAISISASADRLADGKKAYETNCASCHASGANGAPLTNNPEDWVQRSDLWEAVLLTHAKEGYLKMPAKGGDTDASDYDVGVAAEYMLSVVYPQAQPD
ncbi:MAG: c-type cytochrome [Halioglobus sp.]